MHTFESVLAQIKKKQFAPFYLLAGTEAFFIDAIEKALYDEVVEEGAKDFDYSLFYGKDTSPMDIIDAAKRFPMLSQFQLIVVREAQYINESLDPLATYLEQPQPQSIVVFCHKHKDFDKRKKLYKTVTKKGITLSFKPLYDNQIPQWIQGQMKKHQLTISPKGVFLLANYLGANLLKINKELEKLKLVATPGEEIGPELIEKHIGVSKDFNVFELQNAIGSRNLTHSFRIIRYMAANSKSHPLTVTLSTLHGFFQKLLCFHGLPNPQLAAKTLKINPFFVKDYEFAAKHFSMRQASQALHLILQADLKSKGIAGGQNDHEAIMKALLLKLFAL